ncbi:MAG TPA: FAD-binding oxidoreductase [Solirubrobacteraceae bacterium]|nr:FAD-binding oxidoreductase [Solirubrobacteraceae bacterium]
MTSARRNGGISYWYASTATPRRRAPLDGPRTADVAIVGGGFTGLWAAYYLKTLEPSLDVVVLEREFAGFGASGRNGGWLSSAFSASRDKLAAARGRDAVLALQRTMQATVDEVIDVCAREGIDADIVKHGVLSVARGAAQQARLEAELAEDARWELREPDVVELTRAQVDARVRVAGATGAAFSPHCARVHPAKLVRGLAAAVERLGVRIYEGTEVLGVDPGVARTAHGDVRAGHVLICLEGFTAGLEGHERDWVPLNSAMVVTEPLSGAAWREIGWDGAELLGDGAHAYMYAQRTADGRIALGGRGVPYRFGSRTDVDGRTQERTIRGLVRILHGMFPAARGAGIEHAWCGVLGVPRDWSPLVRVDADTRVGIAGGYVGNGVATSNLAGRTLADLVLARETERTALPWVGKTVRRWEPEPLRFVGAHLVYGLYRAADRREAAGLERTSRLAKAASLLAGR